MAPRKDIDATLNTYQNYRKGNVTGSTYHPFNITGHPGKYYAAYDIPDGQSDFTGSKAGVGAVVVKTHGSAVFHLTGGGTVPAEDCEGGGIVELSVKKVTAASSAKISVLKVTNAAAGNRAGNVR